ncbi:alpha/beta fold hydrolase [Streptomyces luomodiensis]|uniref:Alpha/beta fold hydrolase n=1 Tax=Streptomyces luomodiensis TaxID=3026192 RepID=A0ABY9V0V7_9ACTN|nr:alpha/beta fold hydrolase [Streptomyces sp. SCA4-21]WNE97293.1 alpha/beta fold hydrolase [Streptomyces sp. SCA4-21]
MTVGIDSRWFRRYGTGGTPHRRLVCLPHAGGSASFFHGWGTALAGPGTADGVEVLATRYPGRQERLEEPALDSVEALADEITAALLPFADTPLTLFGHSMGASVGYEVALRLETRHGIRPDALFVSSRKAPHALTPKDTYLRGDQALLDEVRGLGGTDTALLDDGDLRELVLPAIRADFKAVGTYGPRAATPVSCPVRAHVGDRDPGITVADMRAWAAVAPAGFDLTVLPGDHFYLVQQQDVLVRTLAAHLG